MFKTVSSLYRRGMQIHRGLTLSTAAMIVGAIISAALIFLDPRVITGVPAWVKPTKFFISIAIYNATWLWLTARLGERTRLVRWTGNVNAFVASLEMVLIVAQVIRGTRSHFNSATPIDAAIAATMGIAITVLWFTNAAVSVQLLRRSFTDPVLGWGIRLGVLATVLGMGTGYLMFQPKPEQKVLLAAGQRAEVGGHAVGAPDDAPGYPFVGWSKLGGDWRPAHFVGLHGLQVLPLVAWLVSRRRSRGLTSGHQVALVGTVGVAYVGLIGVLVSQAVRAQPIFRPDAVTLGLLGALLALAAASAAAIVAHARLGAARIATGAA